MGNTILRRLEVFRSKSLQDLEGPLGRQSECSSYVECEQIRLHTVPLTNLTVENMSLLIGQKVSLKHLVPVALDILEDDPFVGGDFYLGVLLRNVALVPEVLWNSHPELNNRLVEVTIEVESLAKTINKELMPALEQRGFI